MVVRFAVRRFLRIVSRTLVTRHVGRTLGGVSRFTRVFRYIRKLRAAWRLVSGRSRTQICLRNLFPVCNSLEKDERRPCLVSASVWQENRGQRTRVLASLVNGETQSWMRENKEEEENGGGERRRRPERKKRQKRGIGEGEEERRRRWGVSTFTPSGHITCDVWAMLTLPQRRAVVDDAIMVGSWTCERADRKSRFPMCYKTRGVTRIFAWGPRKPLLRVTQLIHELFHVALNPITWAARVATGRLLALLHAQHAVHMLLLAWNINCPRDLRGERSVPCVIPF